MRKRPGWHLPFGKKKSTFDKYFDMLFGIFDKYPREYFVIGFFAIFALMIIAKTFTYTILDHEKYVAMADRQQTAAKVIEVDRGKIYSNNSSGNVLAASVDLNDLAIDPKAPGNKAKLASFLTGVVYKETCEYRSKKDCYNNLLSYFKTNKITDFINREKEIKELILEEIKTSVYKDKVTSVLLFTELTEGHIFSLEKANIAGVYIYLSNLYVNPEEVVDPDFVSFELSKITGQAKEDIKYMIRKRDLRYVKILPKLSISSAEYVKAEREKERELIRKGLISTNEAFSTFIILEPDATRYYPERKLASQITGFVDASKSGRYGIEGYFNDTLKGKEGLTNFKAGSSGFIVDLSKVEEKESAVDGADITLTIDRNIQDEVEGIIERGVIEYGANKGSIIVMNPKTGQVLAMANFPSYDPNLYGDVYEIVKVNPSDYPDVGIAYRGLPILVQDKIDGERFVYKGRYLNLRQATEDEIYNDAIIKYRYKNRIGPGAYRNDVIEYLYEPGSIFKPIIAAMGIDSGDFTRLDMYEGKSVLRIDNFAISNVSDKCTGYISYQKAMNYSCNTGMVNMVQKVGEALVHKYLDEFGFGKPSGITLAGEVNGRLTPYESWSRASLFTRSYGRGMVTTQLKMAAAYGVLANGGVYFEPSVLKKIDFGDGRNVTYEPSASHRVLSEKASSEITAMLVDGVENGVAKNGRVLGYTVAGKTGTSGYVKNGRYEGSEDDDYTARTIASFAGFAPAEDPKFVVVVRLDRPRTNQYGGQTSAHLFSETIKYLFDYYKIPQTRDPEEQLANDRKDIEIKN